MKKFALALAPLALGLLITIALQSGAAQNDVLYLRADLGSFVLMTGLLASGIAAIGLMVWRGSLRDLADAIAHVQARQAHAHRQFIRRLDHEIKNPLTAIRAALANLNVQKDDPPLASVRAQVDRLAKLSADLRKLTELESQPLELESVDLGQLLTELLLLMRERPDAICCQLHLTLPQAPWPLPPIRGDRDLLFLVFHNLLDNALKFSSQGDTIELRAYEDGAQVVAEVADTGPGIAEEELPHLGEELYRGRAARGVEGSGLGLALAQAIVARHNGTLNIRSRLEQGTVVTIRFPIAR